MRSIPAFENSPKGYADLYQLVLVDTPVGPYFSQFLAESAERIGRPSTRDDDHWCWNSEEGVSSITVRAPTLAVAPPGSCEVVIEWPANTTLPPVNVNLRGGSLTRAGESANGTALARGAEARETASASATSRLAARREA